MEEEEPNREIKKIRLIMPNFDENQKKILENAIKAANKDGIEVDVEYPYPSDTTHGPLTNLTLSQQEEDRLIDSFNNDVIKGKIQNKINNNEGKQVCSDEKCELLFKFTEEDYKELKEMGIITGGKKKKRSKKRKSLKKKKATKKKVVKKKKATKKKTKKGKK